MDYERKYKLALERAREQYNKRTPLYDIESIFPELKDSEDERIRKWCISHFNACINVIKDNDEYKEYLSNKVIAWLEKQGEQPTDKFEPKFKIGNWFVNNKRKDIFLIKSITNGYCTLEDIKGNIISPCLPPCESDSHIWTIEDAKNGDVLFDGSNILLFKEVNNWHNITSYLAYSQVYSIREYFISGSDVIMPATKEQRDLLFQKMKEAGYEWDSEKKELKKIEI